MKILLTLFIVFTMKMSHFATDINVLIKSLVLIAFLGLSGCVSTYVKTDKWEFRRVAVGYNSKLPALKMSPAGTIVLCNYDGEVDPELMEAVAKALLLLGKVP